MARQRMGIPQRDSQATQQTASRQSADRQTAEREAPAQRPCGCGCGALGSGRFRPGHDARLHGRVARLRRGESLGDLPSGEIEAAVQAAADGLRLHGAFAQAEQARPQPRRTDAERRAERIAARIARLEQALTEARAELQAAQGTPILDALVAQAQAESAG